jgi:hypothetical protein
MKNVFYLFYKVYILLHPSSFRFHLLYQEMIGISVSSASVGNDFLIYVALEPYLPISRAFRIMLLVLFMAVTLAS